jgi:hypothetical protein
MDFIWRNKGALTIAAALTAFLADPKPFIDGTKTIADSGMKNVAAPIVRSVNWTIIVLVLIALCSVVAIAQVLWWRFAARSASMR